VKERWQETDVLPLSHTDQPPAVRQQYPSMIQNNTGKYYKMLTWEQEHHHPHIAQADPRGRPRYQDKAPIQRIHDPTG